MTIDNGYMNGQRITDLIQKRTSVRTYDASPIEPDKLEDMEAFLAQNTQNPFGANIRFALVRSVDVPGRLGTYGLIRGMKTFFAGYVKPSRYDLEGFGYAFEKAVLYAQSLGFETCWLGGTFRRGAFEQAMAPTGGEILPAVSPLGYARKRRTLTERVVAAGAGARKRKAYGELFYDGDFNQPLEMDSSVITTCLQMVRIGPSASNKQPWRAVKRGGKIHFFLAQTKNYSGNKLFGFCMQRIDMGIAACHLDLTAKELGMNGRISFDDPDLLTQQQKDSGMAYSFTWSAL